MTIDINTLRAAFSGKLLTATEEMAPYLLDWRKRYQGAALAVAEPDTTADVAAVVRWCAARGIAIVPQGGNTGLSGGSVPDMGGNSVVLSLRRLNKIRTIDLQNNTMTVEAGCILETLQKTAKDAGRLFPLSLAAQGSCTIGGNLSTNAGGVQVLRYGNARELCLGLEVVTAQGEVWDGLRGLRKDNTGYDLRDLFIGAEGTLGIITAAVLKLYPLPVAKQVAFVAVANPAQAVALLGLAQTHLGADLTAFELISAMALGLVLKHVPQAKHPIESSSQSPWYVLLECSDTHGAARCQAQMERLFEAAFEANLISDGVLSANETQFRALWALREDISEAQAAEGKNIKHDISVPISRIAEFIELNSAKMAAQFSGHSAVRQVVFGHLGDGNLHYNVSPPLLENHDAFLRNQDAMNKLVHDDVAAFGGSISAEHGLGVLRRDEATRYKSAVEMGLQKAIKVALDPKNLMNPGKVLMI